MLATAAEIIAGYRGRTRRLGVGDSVTRTPLAIRPPAGEDRRVGPRSAAASLPYTTVDVVAGAGGRPVTVHVDAWTLSPPTVDPDEEQTSDVTAGGLTGGQIADRLSLRPGYVRNVINDVRHRPADTGVPGPLSADGTAAGWTDLRPALARWAVEGGAVAELPRPRPVLR